MKKLERKISHATNRQPEQKLSSISVWVEFERNAQAARFQQLEESGGGCSHERTPLRQNSLLTGKNTGNFTIFGRHTVAVIAITGSLCETSGANSRSEPRTEQGIFSDLSGNSLASTGSDS